MKIRLWLSLKLEMAPSWMSFERERIKTNMTIGFRAFIDFERPSQNLLKRIVAYHLLILAIVVIR